tara:strand:- start:174 stop:353 length:180 start_codon:yes stop_codon:yes gene_type:complete
MSFEQWMTAVDRELVNECGLDSSDLPDVFYHGMFEDQTPPNEAAYEALENAGYFDGPAY